MWIIIADNLKRIAPPAIRLLLSARRLFRMKKAIFPCSELTQPFLAKNAISSKCLIRRRLPCSSSGTNHSHKIAVPAIKILIKGNSGKIARDVITRRDGKPSAGNFTKKGGFHYSADILPWTVHPVTGMALQWELLLDALIVIGSAEKMTCSKLDWEPIVKDVTWKLPGLPQSLITQLKPDRHSGQRIPR
jgi:hypothetical protein